MVTTRDGQTVSQALDEQMKVKGRGRPRSLTDEQEDDIVRRYLSTSASLRTISGETGVPRSTCAKVIRRARERLKDTLALSFIEGSHK